MTLNEAYDEYQRTKDLEALYPFVKQRCLQAAATVLHRTPQPDLVVTLTTDVLMSLHKFDAKKSAFSSWVFMDARRNCVNELRRGEAPYVDPVSDPELLTALDWLLRIEERITQTEGSGEASECVARLRAKLADEGTSHFQRWAFDKTLNPPKEQEAADLDESVLELYSRIETVLDPEEQELVRLKLDGLQGEEIAEVLNISRANVDKRFEFVKKKLQKAA